MQWGIPQELHKVNHSPESTNCKENLQPIFLYKTRNMFHFKRCKIEYYHKPELHSWEVEPGGTTELSRLRKNNKSEYNSKIFLLFSIYLNEGS